MHFPDWQYPDIFPSGCLYFPQLKFLYPWCDDPLSLRTLLLACIFGAMLAVVSILRGPEAEVFTPATSEPAFKSVSVLTSGCFMSLNYFSWIFNHHCEVTMAFTCQIGNHIPRLHLILGYLKTSTSKDILHKSLFPGVSVELRRVPLWFRRVLRNNTSVTSDAIQEHGTVGSRASYAAAFGIFRVKPALCGLQECSAAFCLGHMAIALPHTAQASLPYAWLGIA